MLDTDGLTADPIKESTQAFLERPLGAPVEFLCCRLDVTSCGTHVTVAEFRHDDRFWGITDGGDLSSQLMDGCRDTRPDVDAAWLRRRSLYRSAQRRDNIVDIDEIAQDPSVFVDFQRALLTCQSCEKSDYSGVRICQ